MFSDSKLFYLYFISSKNDSSLLANTSNFYLYLLYFTLPGINYFGAMEKIFSSSINNNTNKSFLMFL